jgi:hypothetical protein
VGEKHAALSMHDMHSPMKVHRRLVQQGVVLPDELASDDVGTGCFLHYHYSCWTGKNFSCIVTRGYARIQKLVPGAKCPGLVLCFEALVRGELNPMRV